MYKHQLIPPPSSLHHCTAVTAIMVNIILLAGLVATTLAADLPTQPSSALAYSPPYYPSPRIDGGGDWKAAYQRAKAFVDQLTLTEKVNLTTGTGWQSDNCVGNVGKLNYFCPCEI